MWTRRQPVVPAAASISSLARVLMPVAAHYTPRSAPLLLTGGELQVSPPLGERPHEAGVGRLRSYHPSHPAGAVCRMVPVVCRTADSPSDAAAPRARSRSLQGGVACVVRGPERGWAAALDLCTGHVGLSTRPWHGSYPLRRSPGHTGSA